MESFQLRRNIDNLPAAVWRVVRDLRLFIHPRAHTWLIARKRKKFISLWKPPTDFSEFFFAMERMESQDDLIFGSFIFPTGVRFLHLSVVLPKFDPPLLEKSW